MANLEYDQEQEKIIKKTTDIAVRRAIEKAEKRLFHKAYEAGLTAGSRINKTIFKQTEARLYAYPDLKKNIAKYELDIEDLKKEGITLKSKDIVLLNIQGGLPKSPEEQQEERIAVLCRRMWWDNFAIKEMDDALKRIEGEEYEDIIKMKYFEGLNDNDIAERIHCDVSTVRRNKNKLVNRLAVALYGACGIC